MKHLLNSLYNSLSNCWFKLRACCRLLVSKCTLCVAKDKEDTYTFICGDFDFKDMLIMLLNATVVIVENLDKEDRDYFLKYIEEGGFLNDITKGMCD